MWKFKSKKDKRIEELEAELTKLLKRQGKLNNELKSLKKIKSDLMKNIVSNMDDAQTDSQKQISDSKRLINESNEKMEAYEDELLELPREIDRVNRELMLETMSICYDRLAENTDEIEKIADWIHEIRIQLKKNIMNMSKTTKNKPLKNLFTA